MAQFDCVVLISIGLFAAVVVLAVTNDEKRKICEHLEPIIASCREEFGISKEEVLASKKEMKASLKPCFYACVFKKSGTINDQGLFDAAVVKELQRKYFHEQGDLAKLDEITTACTLVNSQSVTDGDKGCERSKLLVECFIENKDVIFLAFD